MLFDNFFNGGDLVSSPVAPPTEPVFESVSVSDAKEKKAEPFVCEELENAILAYFELYKDSCDVSERMQMGEVVDGAENLFLGLKSAYGKYLDVRSKCFSEPPLSLNGIGVVSGDTNTLVIEANRLIGEGVVGKDILSYEKGKWILCCCK